MDDKTSGKHIIKQGTILAAASVISRIIGMLYRSPMAAVIGDKGNGLYSFAFEIYSIALILSSYSMPLAVSKLLSARFAKKEYKNADKIYKFAYIFAAVSGMVMALILFPDNLIHEETGRLIRPLILSKIRRRIGQQFFDPLHHIVYIEL